MQREAVDERAPVAAGRPGRDPRFDVGQRRLHGLGVGLRERVDLIIAGGGVGVATREQTRDAANDPRGELLDVLIGRRWQRMKGLAVPGADWNAIRDRTDGLVDTHISRPRGQRLVMFTVLALFVTSLCGWLISIVPERRVDRREAMRQALSEVVSQRKIRIEQVRFELGGRCDVERARELAKLLAQDGRTADARTFGTSFIDRCGDDEVVDNRAHAPAPVARPIDWARLAAPDPFMPPAPPMAASLARP